MSQVSDFVGTVELAQLLGISVPTARKYRSEGTIPAPIKLLNRNVWYRSDLEMIRARVAARFGVRGGAQ